MSRTLFPKISAYHQEWLDVGDGHQLYLEQSGNPKGIPVLYLHGGPGGGSSENHRRYFDPNLYHIILFDQRGCGKSTPFAEVSNNTTWDLISDIEKIRNLLNVEKMGSFWWKLGIYSVSLIWRRVS